MSTLVLLARSYDDAPFLTAARQNVKDPPGLFVKTALETLRGLIAFIHQIHDIAGRLADHQRLRSGQFCSQARTRNRQMT